MKRSFEAELQHVLAPEHVWATDWSLSRFGALGMRPLQWGPIGVALNAVGLSARGFASLRPVGVSSVRVDAA